MYFKMVVVGYVGEMRVYAERQAFVKQQSLVGNSCEPTGLLPDELAYGYFTFSCTDQENKN